MCGRNTKAGHTNPSDPIKSLPGILEEVGRPHIVLVRHSAGFCSAVDKVAHEIAVYLGSAAPHHGQNSHTRSRSATSSFGSSGSVPVQRQGQIWPDRGCVMPRGIPFFECP
jgi:hypothetical protein